MPLSADPQKNIEEILRSAEERTSSRFYKLKRKAGMSEKHFMKIVEGAAYGAARSHGYKG